MINTIIGSNSKIEGLLTAAESTRIDGLLEGKIMSESSVIIGEHGLVRGDINAVEILIAGTVYGNLRAEERIQMTETGRVLGDIFTKTLVIDEGASFKGQCTMDVEDVRAIRTTLAEEDTGMAKASAAEAKSGAKKGPDTAVSGTDEKKGAAPDTKDADRQAAKDKNERTKKA